MHTTGRGVSYFEMYNPLHWKSKIETVWGVNLWMMSVIPEIPRHKPRSICTISTRRYLFHIHSYNIYITLSFICWPMAMLCIHILAYLFHCEQGLGGICGGWGRIYHSCSSNRRWPQCIFTVDGWGLVSARPIYGNYIQSF